MRQPPRFVVGTGRCGSTLVSALLSRLPGVVSLEEVFASLMPGAFPDGILDGPAFWMLISEPRPAWTAVLRAGREPPELSYSLDERARQHGVPPILAVCLPALTPDPDAAYAALANAVTRFPPARVEEHYRALFAGLAGPRAWVERSGGSLAYAGDLARRFPGARFVHLHRDGCDTAWSMSAHPFFRAQLLPEGADLDTPIDLERFGTRWSAVMLHGLTDLTAAAGSGAVCHVAYEALVADPERELDRIVDHLGFPPAPPSWRQRAREAVRRRPGAPPAVRARLRRSCAVGEAALRDALQHPSAASPDPASLSTV